MSDDEHSESECYYPKEGNLNVSLRNEKFEASEVFEAREVLNNNEYTDSQEAIDSFVDAQKSGNTVKKTTSDMNNFKSCCKKIQPVKNEYSNTLLFLFFLQPAVSFKQRAGNRSKRRHHLFSFKMKTRNSKISKLANNKQLINLDRSVFTVKY